MARLSREFPHRTAKVAVAEKCLLATPSRSQSRFVPERVPSRKIEGLRIGKLTDTNCHYFDLFSIRLKF